MLPPTDVTGLILAGGRSRRFGSEKAWHLVDDKSMLARVHEAVSAVADTVFISVRDETQAARCETYAPCVIDQYTTHGPLAGIHAGWQQAHTDWLLVVGCDFPFLTAAALRNLLDGQHPNLDAIVAQDKTGHLQPLCACYHRRTVPIITEHLTSRRLALFGFLDSLIPVHTVPFPMGTLRNINHPRDLL